MTLRVARREGTWNPDTLPYAAWIQPARYAAGVFVFIGLGGTVLGIAFSLSSLGGLAGNGGEAATTDQLQTVLRSVGAILSGMKTASICTVLGIAATLFQSWRNNKYLMSASAVMEKAERVWRDAVQVDYAEAKGLQRTAERERQDASLDAVYRRLEVKLTENLNRAHHENTQMVAGALHDMGALVSGAANHLDGSIALFTEHIEGSAQQLTEASQTAARVAETLESVRNKLERAAAALTDTMGEGYAQLGQIQNLIGESTRIITVGHEKLSTVAASLETVVARVGDDRAASLDALTQDRTQTLEALRRDREQSLETLAADRQTLLTGLQATLTAMESERLARGRSRHGQTLDRTFDPLRKTLMEFAALSEQAQLQTAVVEVVEKLDAIQKATLAGATALRTASLAVQNTADAQKEAQSRLDIQTKGWGEARESLLALQALIRETATATARVVAASEQTAEQMMHLVQQQAHDRSDLINLLWRIEAGLGRSADSVTTQINDAAASGGVS